MSARASGLVVFSVFFVRSPLLFPREILKNKNLPQRREEERAAQRPHPPPLRARDHRTRTHARSVFLRWVKERERERRKEKNTHQSFLIRQSVRVILHGLSEENRRRLHDRIVLLYDRRRVRTAARKGEEQEQSDRTRQKTTRKTTTTSTTPRHLSFFLSSSSSCDKKSSYLARRRT